MLKKSILFLAVALMSAPAYSADIYKDRYTREDSSGNWYFTGNLDINGGSIDGTRIGASSAADATFSSVTVLNAATLGKGASTGYLSLKGHGGTNNEEFIIDLETNANSAVIRTGSTGLTTLTFSDLMSVFYQTSSGPSAVFWGYSDKSNTADIEDAVSPNSWAFISSVGSITLVERDYNAFMHIDAGIYDKRATVYAAGIHGNGQRGFVAEMSSSTSTARTPVAFLSKDKNSSGTADHFRATNTSTDVFKVDHSGNLTAVSGEFPTVNIDGGTIDGTRIGSSSAADATFSAATVSGNVSATATITTANITTAIFLSPVGSPVTAVAGAIYVDSTASPNELCFYDGSAWQGLSSGTDANCA